MAKPIPNAGASITNYRNAIQRVISSKNNNRTSLSTVSTPITYGSSAVINFENAGKTYSFLTVSANTAAWITFYTDRNRRLQDTGRSVSTDPAPNSGILLEVVTANSQVISVAPAVSGFTSDGSSNIYAKVINLNPTGNISIAVTTEIIILEE